MRAIIVLILWTISLMLPAHTPSAVVIIPAKPQVSPTVHITEDDEWRMFADEAYWENWEAFTALFNSYETKVAKNGAMMIRQGNSGSFKFAKKG